MAFMQLFNSGCNKENGFDEPAGNQKLPPPKVDASFLSVSDPTLGKEGDFYYIVSSNAAIEGIDYAKGLLIRKTSNLYEFEPMTTANGYILNDVLEGWAIARLKALDGTINADLIKIGQPCLRKINDEWRLYYSVSAGGKTSVIGYASAATPEGPWTDEGEILSSSNTSPFAANSPSVTLSSDNSKLYMAFGNSGEGIFAVEINLTTNQPIGTPVKIASRADINVISTSPELFYHDGYYHLMFTHYWDDRPLTCHVLSADPLSGYKDISGRNAVGIVDPWALTRVMTNFKIAGETAWEGVGGLGVYKDGNKFFVVHHATAAGVPAPILHIREMNWIKDPRRATGATLPFPTISPERYAGEVENNITAADIAGTIYYGTLWGHVLSGVDYGMTFNANGTYNGGTWDFDPSSKILRLISSEWGGEKVYVYLIKSKVLDKPDATVIVGAGINDTFGDFPGVWMKKAN